MKDWTGGRASVFKANGANGLEEREENDFYATDPSCARDIIDILGAESFSENHVIWECACGQGHLAKEFEKLTKATVLSTDLIDRGFGQSGVDFLLSSRPKFADGGDITILTNPPYKYAQDFVEHALMLLKDGERCAFFLKLTFLEGQKRQTLFKRKELESVNVYVKRAICCKGGDFSTASNGSAVCYAWFVFHKGLNADPIIRWIS